MSNAVALQSEFYSLECVAKALSDFREFASATTVPLRDGIRLDLNVNPVFANESKRIMCEFLNYALDLSIKRRFDREV